MNPMPLADKFQHNGLIDQSAAIRVDSDGVLKICDAPGFGLRACRQRAKEQRENERSNRSWDFQITNSPITESQNFLELYRDRLAVRFRGLEELAWSEAEHSGKNVGRERLNFRIQIAHHRVVITPRVLNRIFRLAE